MADDAARAATEAQWIARAQAGDGAAFAQLVRAWQSPVRRQLQQLTHGDAARADDLAQQAFVQAWRALAGFRGEARFGTWLHRIAYTCFLQERRAAPPAHAPLDEHADAASHDPASQRALRLDVARALAQLSEEQRVAIVHCYHLDLSHDEAAAVLGLPLGTLKSHVARGKARLKELLAAWNEEAA